MQKKQLLGLARSVIRLRLGQEDNFELLADPLFDQPRGVFVTLHSKDRLRGCIGYIEAIEPLSKAVVRMAGQAAFADPRFPPLRFDELESLEIEISVLSPLTPIAAGDVLPGVHGVVIEASGQRGVFLPQVATEQGWDRETLLDELCQKAGLKPGLWQHPNTTLFAFTAEVFGERDT